MSDKLSKLEIAKAFAVLGLLITIYTVVSQIVLSLFWRLVIVLLDKIFKK